MAPDLSAIHPRVLIVSRRAVRKNKFIDFVGEYHLDLIVRYGAAPVIVPRVTGIDVLLDCYEPINGVLLCEGEDIDPSHYETENSSFSEEELEDIKKSHASDTAIDHEKDSIELKLVRLCLERNIPYLGICRGSQILNIACGGTLYQDIEKELSKNGSRKEKVVHMDYDNYDGHRHAIQVVENTPLHQWFNDYMEGGKLEISVNSYHHQGVKRLAHRFAAMAFAPDGLIEGFYDAKAYDPEEGKFIVGLQFHPERMQGQESDGFEYPGCEAVYQDFVKAVKAYARRVSSSRNEMMKRKRFVRSFSISRINMYSNGHDQKVSDVEFELQTGPEFLEASMAECTQQEKRLEQMGATVRNASAYINRKRMEEEREKIARAMIGKMSVEQLSDMFSLYQTMGQMCSEALQSKLTFLKAD